MNENCTSSGDDEMEFLRDVVGPAFGMVAVFIGPLMMFYPVSMALQSLLGWGTPTIIDFSTSVAVSIAGVVLSYAAFRITIESDRHLNTSDGMTTGYIDALDDGELEGFLYVCRLVFSRDVSQEGVNTVKERENE